MHPNLAQRRAASAMSKAAACRKREDDGDCLPGYPGLIINNGLLACLAFSIEKSTRKDGTLDHAKQWWQVGSAVADHLHHMGIALRQDGEGADAKWLLKYLAGRIKDARNQPIAVDSISLRRATDEALAFLACLKRFAKSVPAAPAL